MQSNSLLNVVRSTHSGYFKKMIILNCKVHPKSIYRLFSSSVGHRPATKLNYTPFKSHIPRTESRSTSLALSPLRNINSNSLMLRRTFHGSSINHTTPLNTQYQKMKSGLKWLLIRDKERPFSKNELGTLFPWIILSQVVWLILKTTTAVSLLLLFFNTVFAKELVGQTIGDLLNLFNDDINIKFQDALVPEWKKGFIKFHNVELKTNENQKNNFLEFDLNFHQIEINLSLKKWIQGHGLINDLKILGMRGDTVINHNSDSEDKNALLINWFMNHNYQLNNITVSDSSFQLIENHAARNRGTTFYNISIFNLDIPKLRFNQMVVDFLNANVITGSINNSMFSFHKRQHKLSYLNDLKNDLSSSWKRITRLRLNSINVSKIGLADTDTFNWIQDGNVDIIADIMLPHNDEDLSDKYLVIDLKFKFKDLKASLPAKPPTLSTGEKIMSLDELKPIVSFVNLQRILSHESTYDNSEPQIGHPMPNVSIRRKRSYPNVTILRSKEDDKKTIIKFHDSRETISNGNDSKIVAGNGYNPVDNEIILNCRIVKNIKSLENTVLFQETGIYDQLSMELYVDLLKMVEEWEFKNKDQWMRHWGSSFASQLLLFGFTNNALI
ncbi:hypothetical protein KAFR_0E02490 [Kazachstania africana CBS 2517]|uniref:Mitochondrial distribution and morphology protein 32 n=1 Tax=Kazachstania africana (strain ATCC 22294 / BCRC 22015 / CBS 2517 / CECT 1963 / NBRC 1671 / NRRL Y-8276) TaxID=1071382 RepID=H2AVK2_KAZAF|nr:hypothetical protein KAFR_0E02490 [Kazachstania africana CBS 2517]CCF58402.1 hypothetical protein KAFR_0E02490 [Kazachstania africana CBS 2517]